MSVQLCSPGRFGNHGYSARIAWPDGPYVPRKFAKWFDIAVLQLTGYLDMMKHRSGDLDHYPPVAIRPVEVVSILELSEVVCVGPIPHKQWND